MRNVHDDETLKTLRILERRPPRNRCAPVMTDKKKPISSIGIDKAYRVFGQLIYFIGGNSLRLVT